MGDKTMILKLSFILFIDTKSMIYYLWFHMRILESVMVRGNSNMLSI